MRFEFEKVVSHAHRLELGLVLAERHVLEQFVGRSVERYGAETTVSIQITHCATL